MCKNTQTLIPLTILCRGELRSGASKIRRRSEKIYDQMMNVICDMDDFQIIIIDIHVDLPFMSIHKGDSV